MSGGDGYEWKREALLSRLFVSWKLRCHGISPLFFSLREKNDSPEDSNPVDGKEPSETRNQTRGDTVYYRIHPPSQFTIRKEVEESGHRLEVSLLEQVEWVIPAVAGNGMGKGTRRHVGRRERGGTCGHLSTN